MLKNLRTYLLRNTH